MSRQANNQYMEYLRVEQAKTVVSSILNKGLLTATRLTRATPNHGFVDQHVTEDAFLVSVQMRDYSGELWVDGKQAVFPSARKGTATFYDYKRVWQANMVSAFDCINYYIPRTSLAALEEDVRGPLDTVTALPGAVVDDAVIRGLTDAIVPALQHPDRASRLFVDQVGLAFCSHLAFHYCDARPQVVSSYNLSGGKLKRAKEIIDANLHGNLTVAELAKGCGMSAAYFARAFKSATGVPPYRWMNLRRIEKSKELLSTKTHTLREVAAACGFVDQSYFTRVFSQSVGISPGEWRRLVVG